MYATHLSVSRAIKRCMFIYWLLQMKEIYVYICLLQMKDFWHGSTLKKKKSRRAKLMTTVHCMLGDVSMISFSARGAVLTLAQSALVI